MDSGRSYNGMSDDALSSVGTLSTYLANYAAALGLGAAVVCQFGRPFFLWTAQPPDIAAGAGRVVSILGWGAPGTLLFYTTAYFLEGLRRPLPAMAVMIVANLLKNTDRMMLLIVPSHYRKHP